MYFNNYKIMLLLLRIYMYKKNEWQNCKKKRKTKVFIYKYNKATEAIILSLICIMSKYVHIMFTSGKNYFL